MSPTWEFPQVLCVVEIENLGILYLDSSLSLSFLHLVSSHPPCIVSCTSSAFFIRPKTNHYLALSLSHSVPPCLLCEDSRNLSKIHSTLLLISCCQFWHHVVGCWKETRADVWYFLPYFSPFTNRNQAEIWPRFQSLLKLLPLATFNSSCLSMDTRKNWIILRKLYSGFNLI